MAKLRLDGLVKRFGDVTALNGVDLEVQAGEFFAILGPSAAGKTTTLRSIAGLERPDAGSVTFDGRDLTHAPVQGRGMAMIFQTFALYPHLSVQDNLAYPLKQRKTPDQDARARIAQIASMLKITHTLDRKPNTLSGGEQQRLAIGRALIQNPELLLLDEPLANLDAKLRHETRAEFKRLHRELGMTMVYATPDQLEALSMGERIAVLRDGKVVQTGTPDELYETPVDSFVATMVGAPPMNLVTGELRGDDRGSAVIALPFGEVDASRWRNLAARDLIVGIRPHDLTPAERAPDDAHRIPVKVHLTEPLGDVTVLDVEAGSAIMKMALPEEEALAYPAGAELVVAFRTKAVHLFDMESGKALH
ncbi:MAG: ABC transporter ATP-binding protein [Alphaproteobacteria bacterium]|nr:ABC transporter ATP-binding protein [Alphaproteobacteria bacterium]